MRQLGALRAHRGAVGDTSVGETNGNGINSYGGTWYVIKVGEKPGTPVTG